MVVQSANIALKFSQHNAGLGIDMESGAPLGGLPVIFYNQDFNPVARVETEVTAGRPPSRR